MPTHRRFAACHHPLFLSVLVTLGMVSIFAVLVTSLAQAHGLPPALTAGAALAGKSYLAQELPSQGAVAADEPAFEYTAGVVLVKLKEGAAESLAQPGMTAAQGMDVSAAGAANLFRSYGVASAEPLFPAAASPSGYSVQAAHGGESTLSQVYKLHLAPQLDARQIAAALAADANVEYAEPDYMARGMRIPNDPEYGSQWALAKVGAPAAWDLQTGSPDVVIAVIDSGVDTAHPEFGGRLWENDDPLDGVDNDLNGQVDDLHGWNVLANNNDLVDPSGHGTQVGGVVGAAADNGVGVAGMCWNCKLMFVKAMQANGAANYSDVAKAVQYAASNGAQVINLSLGGYADSAVLHDAIREAATTAVIVAGAGNDDSANVFYPAAYPEVLAVAATDQNDQKAIFSNYGAWVDLSAPGVDIRTTALGGYATTSGTSLSAAFVSGLAGLIRSQHASWTPEQVKWQILNTAANIDAANPARAGQLGRGRIDAGAAAAVNPQAKAVVESYALDGRANGRPAPGQSFQLVLTIQNQWLPAQDLQGALSSSDPYVSITDGAGAFGSVASGQAGSNTSDPFAVTVSGSASYNRALAFTLTLSGAGGYTLAVPFTIQVRSAVETLGNTQYTQNTTWTSDKTYILNGAIVVNPGVTLTIEPGTMVKAEAGKFIRIDGTLIAQGTADRPIVFTTNSPTNAMWGGLRFTASAVDADYDAGGAYIAGSVLQYVTISYADVGTNLSTRSPYIADAIFSDNRISIQIGSNNNGGAPHIERSVFTGGGDVGNDVPGVIGGVITLYGGSPLIRQNRFGEVSSPLIGNGSPQILQNTFRNNTHAVIQVSGSPVIIGNLIQANSDAAYRLLTGADNAPVLHDNVIAGNGLGIDAPGLQLVDIQHNLIANNGGVGLRLESWASGSGPSVPLGNVSHNTIIHNGGYGIQLGGPTPYAVSIGRNNIFGNGNYDIYLVGGSAGAQNFTVDAADNFWGIDASQIPNRIHDCSFDDNGCGSSFSTIGKVTYLPPLVDPDQAAPAFVRSVTMDPNPVGMQVGTITVDFSRQMSTTIVPAAQFHDARRGTWETIDLPAAPLGGPMVTKDGMGRTWLGRGTTLLTYNMRQWYTYTVPSGDSNSITALYGASNGDVWAAVCCQDTALVRLRGASWTTYARNAVPSGSLNGVTTIAEDAEGALWFGTGSGAFRFDGSAWRRYTTEDGIAGVEVLQIARDGQGRLWLLAFNSATMEAALNVFDGENWTHYGTADGLPRAYTGPMFGDSKGRIWLHVSNGTTTTTSTIVAMFDGAWHYFGFQSSGGRLINPVSAFGEANDGTIWMRSGGAYGAAVLYRDGVWAAEASVTGTGAFVLDRYDNVWLGGVSGPAAILWRGREYTFENGHWPSDTRFQAEYTFTADVPPGRYALDVAGAVDSAGMGAYATGAASFIVDYGAGVTLDPPYPPSVAAQTSGSLANLAASWTTGGPTIDQYRYAIGTAPGARNTVGWTYLVSTSFVRSDLNLVQGQTYYVTVQAHSSNGMWSPNGISNGIVAGQAPTPSPTPSPTPTVAPLMQPGAGGTQTGQLGDMNLSLSVPPNAISEPIRLVMQPAPAPPSTGGLAMLGQIFAINAQTAGGAPVTQFAVPLTLVIHYTDAAAAGLDESRLQIFYWNEVQQQWVGIPTTVNAEANTLTIYLEHLTVFAALEAEARSPSLYLPQIRR